MACQEKWAVERQLEFLLKEHGIKRVVLIAHDGCAFYKNLRTGHPTQQQQHIDLIKAIERIQSWNIGVEIEAYFARKLKGRIVFEPLHEKLVSDRVSI